MDRAGSAIAEAPRRIVGTTPAVREMWEQIERIGPNPWPVLILGESGTGKELVAKTLHAQRNAGPFVTIDCSAMVGPLMESELFGHVKGAFTGAMGNKLGLIELANGGTAFFDEIGELPLDLQSKLLRVVQEKEFRPVGALHCRRSEFRVIAATNRNLLLEVERGRFREDLYYRLKVITLRLPPLRERRDDIPVLLDHFLRRYGRNHILDEEVAHAVASYHWPGNIRELENCVQHMIGVSEGQIISLRHLPTEVLNHVLAQRSDVLQMAEAVGTSVRANPASGTLANVIPASIVPLPEVERRAIQEALRFTKGDRTMAAALLGIGRTTLYRKLKQYGMEAGRSEFGTM